MKKQEQIEEYYLEIFFNKQIQMKCLLNDIEGNETIINLKKGIDYYTPSIAFDMNNIIICEEHENSIEFMKDMIEQSNEFKEYVIHYQNREYSVIAEVLLALMIYEIKKKVQRKVKLIQTRVHISDSFQNEVLNERMKIALDTIGLEGIEYKNILTYDYLNQGDIFNEIFEKNEEYEKYRKILHRAKTLATTEEDIQKLRFDNTEPLNEETFETICKRFPLKQRSQLKLTQLDNYCVFIASRYLETLEDHQHLTRVAKRLMYNMEKFHYNPIPLKKKYLDLFPNIETYHCYNYYDSYLEGNRISRYIDWVKRGWNNVLERKKLVHDKEIEFKNIIYTKIDRQNDCSEELYIPDGVKEIEDECFYNVKYINELFIPSSVTKFGHLCFYYCFVETIHIFGNIKEYERTNFINCRFLKHFNIIENDNFKIYGKQIYERKPHFAQAFYLPYNIQYINGKKVFPLTSLEIPSYVTSLDDNCFCKSLCLQNIVLPDNLTNIQHNLFKNINSLTSLSMSKQYKYHGDRIFMEHDGCLHSIIMPSSIELFNGEKQRWEQIESYSIPSSVTKLADYCFANTKKLKVLNGISNIKEFGNSCFYKSLLHKLRHRFLVEHLNNQSIISWLKFTEQIQIEKWTGLQFGEILFDSLIDNWSINKSVFNQRIIGKKHLLLIIEDAKGQKFGHFRNGEVIEDYDINYNNVDDESFEFTLTSEGKLSKPMKFDKNIKKVFLYENDKETLCQFGNIRLGKEDEKRESHYSDMNYFGIKNKICDLTYFELKKFMIIQMKEGK